MNIDVRCICPVRVEHRDTVTLRDSLDFRGAMACKQAVRVLYAQDPDASDGDMLAVLTEHYVLHGIVGWTAKEKTKDGWQAVPPTSARIRELVLADLDVAYDIADACDNLYTEAILLPLLTRGSTSSPPTPTEDESTSPPTGSEPTPLKPSKRSSTTTTQTAATGTTTPSPDGASNSSQSSTSAA
jgi:hypothetical protein